MGGRRGQLITLSERQYYSELIDEAVTSGARKEKACELIGLSIRSLQRWQHSGDILADKRQCALRPEPVNKLSKDENQAVLDVCNQPEYAALAPSQIVPLLADKGVYLASESTFYRILKANSQLSHRGNAKPKKKVHKPKGFTAKGPNEVWTWDISYLPSTVIGRFYYLYMIMDIYSRKVVGWEVHGSESGEHAADLLERTLWAEKCVKEGVVLHSDNGSPMKCLTMQTKMLEMGVIGSRSRPGVSNDNPYSESLFHTVKYCRRWPSEGFKDLAQSREWLRDFVEWYNTEHRHSRIKFVAPIQRHNGEDKEILVKRDKLYQEKRKINPSRWSKNTRNWDFIEDVKLNPDKEKEAA